MSDSAYSAMAAYCETLKLDFSSEELARLAMDNSFSPETLDALGKVFAYLGEKKKQTTIQMLLRTSRLPQKSVKTFDNFDFSVLKGKDLEHLRNLRTLGAIHAHRNIAFIGPAGTGKRIWRRRLASSAVSRD